MYQGKSNWDNFAGARDVHRGDEIRKLSLKHVEPGSSAIKVGMLNYWWRLGWVGGPQLEATVPLGNICQCLTMHLVVTTGWEERVDSSE